MQSWICPVEYVKIKPTLYVGGFTWRLDFRGDDLSSISVCYVTLATTRYGLIILSCPDIGVFYVFVTQKSNPTTSPTVKFRTTRDLTRSAHWTNNCVIGVVTWHVYIRQQLHGSEINIVHSAVYFRVCGVLPDVWCAENIQYRVYGTRCARSMRNHGRNDG